MSAVATERTEAVAHLKFARVGPRKLRRVADAIRGKSVREALVLLKFAGVFASEPIEKLLRSAVANAENNHDMSSDGLFVTRITVDGGPGGGLFSSASPPCPTASGWSHPTRPASSPCSATSSG